MTSRVAPPALNSDAYRSRSMARMGGPPPGMPPSQVNSFNHTSASAFRQQPYNSMTSRTPSGRPIPERNDERATSMNSFTPSSDRSQTMSGRIIPVPHRRRESGGSNDLQLEQRSPERSFVSLPPNPRGRRPSESSLPSRSMSMVSTAVSPPAPQTDSLQHRPSVTKSDSQSTAAGTIVTAQRRAPLVYPALLSRVADTFRERVTIGDRTKNDLSYKNSFTGAEAVDIIAYIIKTTDRNLALLLGRALDAQKFFHDVTYDHRLRDSIGELYQFKETMNQDETHSEVNGVFTLLTECYSPTCTRDNLCYSIACPRRLEQQARLNMKPQPILKSSTSRASLHGDDTESHQLWINSVSKEVADGVGDREKKRQEVISEIAYTERDFVKDLEYLRDFWMIPLRAPGIQAPVPEHRREKFIRTVFSNIMEVHTVNQKFSEALTSRQRENPVVRNVGDIFLAYVPKFDPFIKYGANQLYGKYEFEKEKAQNPKFALFTDETERLKESRKLELNGYLTKPTTRLARYPLLLDNVLKYTADDNPDKKDIPKAIGLIRDFLTRVNIETGKAENHFTLTQLYQALKFNPGEFVDLKLNEENRQLIFKGALKKSPTDNAEVQVYLFDHAVLLVRIKTINKKEETKVYRKPIPLELLVIAQMDEVIPKVGIAKRTSSSLIPAAKTTTATPTGKEGFPITFKHIGKGGYDITLYAHSQVSRRKWMEHIEAQQRKIRERSNFFTKTNICDNFFTSSNKVNCLVPTGL
jgi:hypothetical protein